MKDEDWLDLAKKLNGSTTYTSSSVKIRYKDKNPLMNVPVEALFELYGNLILAGFEKDEALYVICGVLGNNNERTS